MTLLQLRDRTVEKHVKHEKQQLEGKHDPSTASYWTSESTSSKQNQLKREARDTSCCARWEARSLLFRTEVFCFNHGESCWLGTVWNRFRNPEEEGISQNSKENKSQQQGRFGQHFYSRKCGGYWKEKINGIGSIILLDVVVDILSFPD